MVKQAHLVAGGLLLALAACSGADGAAGPAGAAGAKGASGNPGSEGKKASGSISLVSPRAAVIGGITEVTISVDGVDLATSASVTFGAGIKVTGVVASGRTLRAELEVAENAAPGPRDIELTNLGEKLTFTGGFVVAPGMGTKVTGGKAEQGGLVQIDVTNNDAEYFDKDNFTVFPTAADQPFAQLDAPFIGPKDARLVLLVDPSAKAGAMGIAGTNYPDDNTAPIYIGDSSALNVAARTPEALGATAVTKSIAAPFQSFLFKYTTAANKLNVVSFVPTGAGTPLVIALGSTGKLSDLLSQQAVLAYPTTAAGSSTVIVANGTPSSAAPFGFTAQMRSIDTQPAVAENDAVPHDGQGGNFQPWGAVPAVNDAAPAMLLNGELKAGDTADVYRVTGAANAQIEASILTEAPVSFALSANANFPNNAQTQSATVSAKAGSVVVTAAGANRFIRVRPSGTRRGKYTLAVRIRP
ncbi:MAG: IPT/TIG domain-containing protein [Polyangiaceae bacterium]